MTVAIAHFALSLVAIVMAFSGAMGRFDHPEREPGVIDRVFNALATVLPQPTMLLLDAVGPVRWPPVVQWAVLFANSLLWALALTAIVAWMKVGRQGSGPGTNG